MQNAKCRMQNYGVCDAMYKNLMHQIAQILRRNRFLRSEDVSCIPRRAEKVLRQTK